MSRKKSKKKTESSPQIQTDPTCKKSATTAKKKLKNKIRRKKCKDSSIEVVDLTAPSPKKIKKNKRKREVQAPEPSRKRKKTESIDLTETKEYSVEEQMSYILHPVNVLKTIRNQLPVYRFQSFESGGKRKTMKQMDSAWEKLKTKKLKTKDNLVEGCMLTYLNLLPPRETKPKYVSPDFCQADTHRILEFLDPVLETSVRNYISSHPSERDLLCTLLYQGVYLSNNLFSEKQVKVTSRVHDLFYQHVNKKMRSSYGVTDVRNANEIPFREFLFRGAPDDGAECKTLDLSLMLGAVQCGAIPEYIENLSTVQSIKSLYSHTFPKKELRLVNCGFFQSPQGNDGQHWHTDESVNPVNATCVRLPELFTLVIALTNQSVDEFGSTGSTVFALGSHLPVHIARKLYTSGYDIISPILQKGDAAIFAGNLFHYGGAFKNQQIEDNRLLLYAVFHLLEKTDSSDALLKTDKNISEIQQCSSFFGGRRLQITVDEHDEVTIERCRRSLHRG